jgi:ribosomal subunit interface protein
MEKIVSARHFTMRDDFKAEILAALEKFESEYHKLTSARVIMDHEKAGFACEIILHGKHLEIEAKGKGLEPKPAFDMAFDKADRQLRKHLEKVHDHAQAPISANELKVEEKSQE